jgi:hypothetical protein
MDLHNAETGHLDAGRSWSHLGHLCFKGVKRKDLSAAIKDSCLVVWGPGDRRGFCQAYVILPISSIILCSWPYQLCPWGSFILICSYSLWLSATTLLTWLVPSVTIRGQTQQMSQGESSGHLSIQMGMNGSCFPASQVAQPSWHP